MAVRTPARTGRHPSRPGHIRAGSRRSLAGGGGASATCRPVAVLEVDAPGTARHRATGIILAEAATRLGTDASASARTLIVAVFLLGARLLVTLGGSALARSTIRLPGT